jgi:hypothetical protein
MGAIDDAAAAIAEPSGQGGLAIRQGVVVTTSGRTATITLGNDPTEIPGIHTLKSYTATQGDTVWVLTWGSDLLILGAYV